MSTPEELASPKVDPHNGSYFGLGLGVSNLTRMTVVKLKGGGLFVYAPIAPTKECVALVRELEAPVQYIVLPTTLVSAGGRAARGGED